MKYAIYVRVSKRKDQCTENQELILVDFARKMGYEFEIFREEESTRKTRPVKNELLKRLRLKDFDGLLILKLDRWGRSLQELVMDFTELQNKHVILISLRDNLDLSTPSGMLQFQIFAAFCEYERAIIRERTLDGLDRARSQGRIGGRPRKKPLLLSPNPA